MEISYDSLISEFIDARVASDGALWKQAAIAFYLKNQMKVTGKQIASDAGYSGSYISKLIKTFTAFPEETERAMDKSFSLHMVCADTEDPQGWLNLAVAEAYSVRQLKQMINEGKPEKSEIEVAALVWDKVVAILENKGDGADWLRQRVIELQMSLL